MERRKFLKSVAGAATLTQIGNQVNMDLNEDSDLPSFQEMIDWDETYVTLAIEGEGWRAVCSPPVDTEVRCGAPFFFKAAGDPPSDEEVGELFSNQFTKKVDEIFEVINGSDNPLEAIMDLDEDELVVNPPESPEEAGEAEDLRGYSA